MRTGAFSGAQGGGGGRGGDKAVVNVEVGAAGWTERINGNALGGVRKGGKDRLVLLLVD